MVTANLIALAAYVLVVSVALAFLAATFGFLEAKEEELINGLNRDKNKKKQINRKNKC